MTFGDRENETKWESIEISSRNSIVIQKFRVKNRCATESPVSHSNRSRREQLHHRNYDDNRRQNTQNSRWQEQIDRFTSFARLLVRWCAWSSLISFILLRLLRRRCIISKGQPKKRTSISLDFIDERDEGQNHNFQCIFSIFYRRIVII